MAFVIFSTPKPPPKVVETAFCLIFKCIIKPRNEWEPLMVALEDDIRPRVRTLLSVINNHLWFSISPYSKKRLIKFLSTLNEQVEWGQLDSPQDPISQVIAFFRAIDHRLPSSCVPFRYLRGFLLDALDGHHDWIHRPLSFREGMSARSIGALRKDVEEIFGRD